LVGELKASGYATVTQVAKATMEDLMKIKGVGEKTAVKILEGAKEMIEKLEAEEAPAPAAAVEEAVSVEEAAPAQEPAAKEQPPEEAPPAEGAA
jgi:DNA-directed RNA polymerase alpha subunit